jgi:elongation factor 1 alpha-like protein
VPETGLWFGSAEIDEEAFFNVHRDWNDIFNANEVDRLVKVCSKKSDMSRHRNVRQLVEDDYYDDDYDDDYDDYDDGYTGGSSNMQAKKKKAPVVVQQVAAKKAQLPPKGNGKSSTPPPPSKVPPPKPAVAKAQQKLQPKAQLQTKETNTSASNLATSPSSSDTVTPASPQCANQKNTASSVTASLPVPQILRRTSTGPVVSDVALTVVVLGHVDAGKSTVTGHLLHGTTSLKKSHHRSSNSSGNSGGSHRQQQPINYAWILDEDEQERAHGVTMDIATKVLALDPNVTYLQSPTPPALSSSSSSERTIIWTPPPHVSIVLQDAPGHADYVPAMITGAALADAAVLVVDATDLQGGTALEAGQLREHVYIARGLGVSQLTLVVNKMDVVGWDQQGVYRAMEHKLMDFVTRTVGYPAHLVQCLPVSGSTGTNLFPSVAKPKTASGPSIISNSMDNATALLRSWYHGPTLLEALYRLKPPIAQNEQLLEQPLRIVVSDVLDTSSNVTVRVKIVSGWVKQGETVVVLPVGDEAVFAKFHSLHQSNHAAAAPVTQTLSKTDSALRTERRLYGAAGELLDGVLVGIDAQRVAVGSILVRRGAQYYRPVLATQCRAKIFVLDGVTVPLIRGAQLMFHMHHIDVPCYCTALIRTVQSERNGSNGTVQERPRALSKNMTAIVELQLAVPVCLETYVDCRALGRFVLRRSGDSVAVGRIEKVLG